MDRKNQRLSEALIRIISGQLASGHHPADIAEKFRVAESTVYDIRAGRRHSDITGIQHDPRPPVKPRRDLTGEEREKVLRLARDGVNATEITRIMRREDDPTIGYDSISALIRRSRDRGELPPPKVRRGRLPGGVQPQKVPFSRRWALEVAGDLRMRQGKSMTIQEKIAMADALEAYIIANPFVCPIDAGVGNGVDEG